MVVLRRLAYRAAYRVMQVWWFVRRPSTKGVKLVLRRADEVLFVRHTYGSQNRWELPGGGMRRGETVQAAAAREAREELGIELADWVVIGEQAFTDHATARLTCLLGAYDGQPVRLDPTEIAEARWAPRKAPPRPLGDHARAFLALEVLEGADARH